MLGACLELLGLLSVELLTGGLDLGLEIVLRPAQFGFVLQCQRFKRPRLGIHLQRQHRILFLLFGDQGGKLLIGFQRLRSAAQFGLELFYLRLELPQFGTGVLWRHKGTGLEFGAVLADDW